MPWIIDTDLFIEGERGNAAFVAWLESADGVATADVVRGEFLIGVHAVADEAVRKRGVQFYSDRISGLPSFCSEPADYAKAATMAGDGVCARGRARSDGGTAAHMRYAREGQASGCGRDGRTPGTWATRPYYEMRESGWGWIISNPDDSGKKSAGVIASFQAAGLPGSVSQPAGLG